MKPGRHPGAGHGGHGRARLQSARASTGPLKLSRRRLCRYPRRQDREVERSADPGRSTPVSSCPNRTIVIVARQDRSGTTFALTNHLNAISPEWQARARRGDAVDWSGAGHAGARQRRRGRARQVERGRASDTSNTGSRSGCGCRWRSSRTRRAGTSRRAPIAAGGAGSEREEMPDNLRLYLPDPEGEESYPIVA